MLFGFKKKKLEKNVCFRLWKLKANVFLSLSFHIFSVLLFPSPFSCLFIHYSDCRVPLVIFSARLLSSLPFSFLFRSHFMNALLLRCTRKKSTRNHCEEWKRHERESFGMKEKIDLKLYKVQRDLFSVFLISFARPRTSHTRNRRFSLFQHVTKLVFRFRLLFWLLSNNSWCWTEHDSRFKFEPKS